MLLKIKYKKICSVQIPNNFKEQCFYLIYGWQIYKFRKLYFIGKNEFKKEICKNML